ncbi:hypothetical protein SK128_009432 [Halocaridina rubra]|uniref:Uncharacterized protein n=1 Tax=Halocaridina rubra TaxID=373956 RepID=A0AAN8ZWC4_HALRR
MDVHCSLLWYLVLASTSFQICIFRSSVFASSVDDGIVTAGSNGPGAISAIRELPVGSRLGTTLPEQFSNDAHSEPEDSKTHRIPSIEHLGTIETPGILPLSFDRENIRSELDESTPGVAVEDGIKSETHLGPFANRYTFQTWPLSAGSTKTNTQVDEGDTEGAKVSNDGRRVEHFKDRNMLQVLSLPLKGTNPTAVYLKIGTKNTLTYHGTIAAPSALSKELAALLLVSRGELRQCSLSIATDEYFYEAVSGYLEQPGVKNRYINANSTIPISLLVLSSNASQIDETSRLREHYGRIGKETCANYIFLVKNHIQLLSILENLYEDYLNLLAKFILVSDIKRSDVADFLKVGVKYSFIL